MTRRELPLTSDWRPLDPGSFGLSHADTAVRRAAFASILGGRAPDVSQLAEATGLPVGVVRDAVASLVRGGQLAVDDDGRIVGSGGLSLVPTRHWLRLGPDAFHTWCAIDAVGIPAALAVDAVARTPCPTCGGLIKLKFTQGRAEEHAGVRAWLPALDCCASVMEELCPDMNLFCGEQHLLEWRRGAGDPSGMVLSLRETAELGREWWADFTKEERYAEGHRDR